MTRFINKGPEGYQPFAPQHARIFSHVSNVAQSVDRDGLFYLKGEHTTGAVVSITDYQQWCEAGWKQQHGTYEAATRFIDKLIEEAGEMRQALIEFRQSGSDLESEEATELLSELGDVLWCTTALASNSSADIDAGLKNRLSDYTMGVVDHSSGQASPTSWRDTAGNLSHKFTNITTTDVDQLIKGNFEPLPSPIMNLWDDEPELGISQHVDLVQMNAFGIQNAVSQHYGYGELDESFIMPSLYDKLASDIAVEAAEIFLNVAYIAQRELGADLGEVIKKNIAKINGRIEAGRVDKTDGQRDVSLL